MSERDPRHGHTNVPSPSRLPSSQEIAEELPPEMFDPAAPGAEVPPSDASKEGRLGSTPDARRRHEERSDG